MAFFRRQTNIRYGALVVRPNRLARADVVFLIATFLHR